MAFLAFMAYLVFVLIRPQEFVPQLLGFPVVRFALIITMLLLLFQKGKRVDGPQSVFVICFLIVMAISSPLNGWFGGAIVALQLMLTTAVLPYFVVTWAISTERRTWWSVVTIIVAAMVMVSNGISQVASPLGIGWAGVEWIQGSRIAYLGIFNDPNDLSMFLVMTLPLIAWLYSRSGFVIRMASVAAAGAVVYGVYLTNSRGGLLGLMSLAGLWFYEKYGAAKSAIVGLVGLPVVFYVMSRFREIDPDEASASGRLEAWYEGFQLLFWKPLFGVGFANFTDYHHLTAHNSFVIVFAELGLLGFFSWLGFVFFCCVAATSLWIPRVQQWSPSFPVISEFHASLGRALSYSMLGYFVTGFFLSRAYTPLLYIFCGIIIAVFYQAVDRDVSRDVLSLKLHGKKLVGLFAGIIVSIYLIVRVFL